jgi:hypothetical protein
LRILKNPGETRSLKRNDELQRVRPAACVRDSFLGLDDLVYPTGRRAYGNSSLLSSSSQFSSKQRLKILGVQIILVLTVFWKSHGLMR